MSLTNQNADEMSMGQLGAAKQEMTGAIADAAKALNEGRSPNFSGNRDSLAADIATSGLMGGAHAGQVALGAYDDISSGRSRFFSPAKSSRGRHTNALGHTMTYAEQKREIRREAREISHIARTGRAPKPRNDDGVLKMSRGVFVEKAAICQMSIGPGGYMPKFMKITPAIMINLGLVPQGIKSNLDHVHKKLAQPEMNQIIIGLNRNEQSGDQLFNNATGATQQEVARIMPQAFEQKNVEGEKPAAPVRRGMAQQPSPPSPTPDKAS